MKRKAAVLAALLLLLSTGAVSKTARPSTNLDAVLLNTDPVPLQSGEDAEIGFKIRNTGNIEAENVEVRILDSFPFRLKPDTKRNYSIGDVKPGMAHYIFTEVLVSGDAPDGINDLKVRISHGGFSKVVNIPLQVQSRDIELNLANLRTSPAHLTPGTESATLSIEVVNNGERTAENVVLDIGLPSTLQETSTFSTRQALGNVKPGEVKTAEFSFDVRENASKGDFEIPVDIGYSTDDSQATSRITEETLVGFHLAGRPQYRVVDVDSSLESGSEGQIRVTVRNTGSEKSSSTRIRVLDSSELPFNYDSASQYIGTLEPGQNGTAVFETTVESGAEVKKYLIDFEVRGVKDTQVFVEDTTVPVEVREGEGGSPLTPLAVLAGLAVIAAAGYAFRGRIRSTAS
ncbi:MAG: COG1361 S-layer family protein [Candidatus Nanohaloarchaea archaeon]